MNEILWHIPTILLVVFLLPPLALVAYSGAIFIGGFWWSCCEVIWEGVVNIYEHVEGRK